MTEFSNVLSLQVILLLSGTFILAGFVKGLAGFGMPLITVPAVTLLTGVPVTTAMGWSLGAIMAANLVQVVLSRCHRVVLIRVWPLFAGLILSMLLSVQLLAYLNSDVLSMLVGAMILVLVLSQLVRPWKIQARWQPLFLGASGVISGTVGGMTSFFSFPALQSILAVGVSKGEFICAVSLMYLIGGLIIGSALSTLNLMSTVDMVISISCLLPALVGLLLGQWARDRMAVETFKRVVLGVLLATGSSMVLNGWL